METPKVPETKVVYYPEEEETGYLVRVHVNPEDIVLGDVKTALGAAARPNSKFFFKSQDPELGVVKEEIKDDDQKLPIFKGSVVCFIVSADGSNHSDTTSQYTDNNATLTPGGVQRTQGIGDSRPPSFHAHGENPDQSTCTSETESTISGLPNFPRHGSKLDRRVYRGAYERRMRRGLRTIPRPDGSTMTSDLETTSFVESEDDRASRISSSTDFTSVSRVYQRQRRKRKRMRNVMSRTSSISSITESSMSLNIINVTLNMDTVSFLGISIVGQTNQGGDGGIYVGSVMNGGAVALDGRIEPGDLILQVNEMSFETMNNDEAVHVLREAVRTPGPIKLVVAKSWDPSPKGYFTIPRTEPVRPIDPGAWVAHTNAMRDIHDIPAPLPGLGELPARPPSVSTVTSNSGSLPSSVPESDRYWQDEKIELSQHDKRMVTRAMARPDSGLEVKNRTWLKINIPDSFLGSGVVTWLMYHVTGLQKKEQARRYAAELLREGYIMHTANKSTFSEKCQYVFNEMQLTEAGVASMRLDPSQMPPFMHHGTPSEVGTLPPLPPPTAHAPTPTVWAMGAPASLTPTPTNTYYGNNSDDPLATPQGAPPSVRGPSMAGSMGSLPGGPPHPWSVPPHPGPPSINTDVNRPSELNSTASGGSVGSGSGSDRNVRSARKPPPVPPRTGPSAGMGSGSGRSEVGFETGTPRPPPYPTSSASVAGVPTSSAEHTPTQVNQIADELAASRQSFKMAMGNPCAEYFVDVM